MAAGIKIPLGMEIGLGPDDFVLDGDPAPPSQKGGRPPPKFFADVYCGQNSLMDQDCSWHGGRPPPQPRQLCIRSSTPPQFSAHFYCGQTAGCIKMPLGMEVGLSPGDFVLDGGPSPPPKFLAHVYTYCDFIRTLNSRYWFVQVQLLVLYAFCF